MQITLSEANIRAGIALYLVAQGITGVTADSLQVTFKAGRKGSGLSAEVNTDGLLNGQPIKAQSVQKAIPGESTGIPGNDEAARELQARRDAADEELANKDQAKPAPVAEEAKDPATEENKADTGAEPEAPAKVKDEGGSLFS